MSARKFKPNDTVDFVVVGSGAAGGVMARELSQAGFEVLVLEQGPRFTAADFRHDELDYWFNGALTNKLDTNPQTFRKTAAEKARARHGVPCRVVRAERRRQFGALHRELLAPARGRLQRAQPPRRDRRHHVRRLADHLRRTRALLHQGRVGSRRVRARRREPVRPVAQQAVPDAAAAGEVLGRAARARRTQDGLASVPGADGDRLGALQGPRRLRALRVLHRLRLRNAGEVVDAVHDDPGSRGHGTLRGAAAELRVAHRDERGGSRDRRRLFRQGQARALPEGTRGRRCAPTAPRRRGCC